MNLLTDECVHKPTVDLLRQLGHDVQHVPEMKLAGLSNGAVLQLAQARQRILLTWNARHFPLRSVLAAPDHPGIIVFTISENHWRTLNPVLERFLSLVTEDQIQGKYIRLYLRQARIYSSQTDYTVVAW